MERITTKGLLDNIKETEHKTERDELIDRLVQGINASRIGTQYKPVTKRQIAIRINKNPFLAKHDKNGDLRLLIKECEERGNYSKFFYVTK